MGQHSAFFFAVVENDLITAQNLDSLTLSDVTGRSLGDACAKLLRLTSLTIQCSPQMARKERSNDHLAQRLFLALCTRHQF